MKQAKRNYNLTVEWGSFQCREETGLLGYKYHSDAVAMCQCEADVKKELGLSEFSCISIFVLRFSC